MISPLILQHIFSIPTDALLIIFLKYHQEPIHFSGVLKVPYSFKFTGFKQNLPHWTYN